MVSENLKKLTSRFKKAQSLPEVPDFKLPEPSLKVPPKHKPKLFDQELKLSPEIEKMMDDLGNLKTQGKPAFSKKMDQQGIHGSGYVLGVGADPNDAATALAEAKSDMKKFEGYVKERVKIFTQKGQPINSAVNLTITQKPVGMKKIKDEVHFVFQWRM